MRKFASIFIITSSILISCLPSNNNQDLHNERILICKEAIDAFSKFDTLRLYDLIDTAYYFDAYNKEWFLSGTKYLYERFQECGTAVVDSSIKIIDSVANSKEYSLPFCRNSDNSINGRSFDLMIRFTDYEDTHKILSFGVNNFINNKRIVPTKPISDSAQ